MKTIAYITIATIILSSCSGNKFLSRKYTTGFFTESHNSLKHNTIKVKSETSYASLNSTIDLKKSNCFSEFQTEKEIINAKVSSITKKDSIFHVLKKGKDEIIIVKNNLPHVYVKINSVTGAKTITDKKIKFKPVTKTSIEKDLRLRTTIGLCLSFIPIMGFMMALYNKKRIRKYQNQNSEVNYTPFKALANLGLGLSILPSLLACLLVLAVAALIIALCFSTSGFFAIALF